MFLFSGNEVRMIRVGEWLCGTHVASRRSTVAIINPYYSDTFSRVDFTHRIYNKLSYSPTKSAKRGNVLELQSSSEITLPYAKKSKMFDMTTLGIQLWPDSCPLKGVTVGFENHQMSVFSCFWWFPIIKSSKKVKNRKTGIFENCRFFTGHEN